MFINKALPYATVFGIESDLIKKVTPIMDDLNIDVNWCSSDLYSIGRITSSINNYSLPKPKIDL